MILKHIKLNGWLERIFPTGGILYLTLGNQVFHVFSKIQYSCRPFD
jgi:hypothetical protein